VRVQWHVDCQRGVLKGTQVEISGLRQTSYYIRRVGRDFRAFFIFFVSGRSEIAIMTRRVDVHVYRRTCVVYTSYMLHINICIRLKPMYTINITRIVYGYHRRIGCADRKRIRKRRQP